MVSHYDDIYWQHEVKLELEKYPAAIPSDLIKILYEKEAPEKEAPDLVTGLIAALEHALEERARSGPHPAVQGLMPLSLIARAAVLALLIAQEKNQPPSDRLILLLKRLLNVEGYMRGSTHQEVKERHAIVAMSLVPDITAQELAEEVGVSASTASRWLRERHTEGSDLHRWVTNLPPAKAEAIESKKGAAEIKRRILDRRKATKRGRPKKSRSRKTY